MDHNLPGDYDLLMSIQVATELPATCTINQVAYLVGKGTENISSVTFSNLVFFMFAILLCWLLNIFVLYSLFNSKCKNILVC